MAAPPGSPGQSISISSIAWTPTSSSAAFIPAFLYESLWSLGTFILLHSLASRTTNQLRRGELFGIYMIAYGLGRVLMELIRLDSRTLQIGTIDLGLPVATVVSLLVALVMAAWIIGRRRLTSTSP